MKAEYVLLELQNLNFIRPLQSLVFSELSFINKDKCLEKDMTWFCETYPHITLIGDLKDITNNAVYRQLKYKKPELWDKFYKKISSEGIWFNELIIDTFNKETCKVLKINCTNCNAYEELKELHELLKGLPNEEKYDTYNPHITLTYLKPNISDSELYRIIDRCKTILPKRFQVTNISMSSTSRALDKIKIS